MRNPSGYGGIKKLSGNRRRPYAVTITTKYELTSNRKDISFLQEYIDPDLFKQVQLQYDQRCPDVPVAKQKQQIIGYYATRADAMIALAEYNKNPYDIDKRNITFQNVYDILLKNTFSKMKYSALKSYTTAYDKCSGICDIRMHEMRKNHMQAIIDAHADKSASTQNNIIALFHAVYKFCMENDVCEKDYSQFLAVTSEKNKKEKKPFTRDEIAILWNNLDWTYSCDRGSMFDNVPLADTLLIMIYTGIRISELLNIKACDVHLSDRYIDLHGTKTKAAQRIVPIHKKIMPLIEKRLEKLSDNDLLISNKNGNAIIANVYRKVFFDHLCSDLKLQEHTPHECRHSFATYAAACKLNPILVKKIIGHSAQDLTQDVYTHAMIDDLIIEIDKLKI